MVRSARGAGGARAAGKRGAATDAGSGSAAFDGRMDVLRLFPAAGPPDGESRAGGAARLQVPAHRKRDAECRRGLGERHRPARRALYVARRLRRQSAARARGREDADRRRDGRDRRGPHGQHLRVAGRTVRRNLPRQRAGGSQRGRSGAAAGRGYDRFRAARALHGDGGRHAREHRRALRGEAQRAAGELGRPRRRRAAERRRDSGLPVHDLHVAGDRHVCVHRRAAGLRRRLHGRRARHRERGRGVLLEGAKVEYPGKTPYRVQPATRWATSRMRSASRCPTCSQRAPC